MGAIQNLVMRFNAARRAMEPRYPGEQRIAYSGRTLASVYINADTAITVSAVWACLRYLSQTVAVLPWHVMKDDKRGAEIQSRNSVDWLLYKRPNPEWSSFQFRETLTHWALRHGNGYAEIEPDSIGRPVAMWPIHPDRVDPCRAKGPMVDDYGTEIADGALYYEVSNGSGSRTILAASRMFHIRGFGEGPVGVNVIQYAAESIGWAKAAQLFGAAFFGNGMNVSGVFQQTGALKEGELERLRTDINAKHGGIRKAFKAFFAPMGVKWETTSVEPGKGQFMETNEHLVEEICRWFGVPPHKVMHLKRSTFNNIEHQAIEVVIDSVSPWVKRFEDEADAKLFGQNRPGLYSKMNMRALLRGDVTARIAYYDGMVKIGAYSPNDVLEREDENTIGPAGDIHVMQNQNVTLETIAAGPPEPIAAIPAEPAANDMNAIAAVERISAILRVSEHV
jgi:HK97 family phage portal protein